MKRPTVPRAGIVGTTALREAKATELGAVVALVERALGEQSTYAGAISAFYPDRVVTVRDGRKWATPYTIAEDNTVTLGAPEEVVEQHVPVSAMREAAQAAFDADQVRFVEAADGGRFLIRVIRAGESLNKVMYPADVLREAAPLFNGARVFNKTDEEHIQGKGKSFDNLIGELQNARYTEAHGGEILADLVLIEPDGPVSTKLREAVRRNLTRTFGFSIDAEGHMSKKGRQRVARTIEKVTSVDLIVEPAAFGELIRMVEALDRNPHESIKEDTMRERMIEAIARKKKGFTGEGMSDDEVMALYREAVADEGTDGGDAAVSKINAAVADGEARMALREAKADARDAIAASKLPQAAKDKLTARFAEAKDVFDAEAVSKAIADEAEYLGKFVESGKVTMGGLDIQVEDRSAKIRELLDGFFAGTGPIGSFREAYREITGDKNVTGMLADCDRGRMAESLGVYREALTTSSWADALGDSVARRMQEVYTGETDLQSWRRVARVTRVNDFRSQERFRIGGYGNLPVVNQAASYNALTSPGDDKATYALAKRGGTETITLEMIANDDVGAIRQIPVELALSAANTLYEFVFDFFRTNPTIYDAAAFFHASHGNLATTALDATSFAAARLAMAKQVRAGSGKRLGLQPKTIMVPPDLQETAYNLFQRGSNNDKTFVQAYSPDVIVVPYWTDANDWCTAADPMRQAALEVGFYNGQENPELFVQDSPSHGSMFSNDQITYKIRHIYSGAVLVDGEKAATKNVVA